MYCSVGWSFNINWYHCDPVGDICIGIANLIFDTFLESSSALIIVTHDISLANRCDQQIEIIDGKVL